MISNSGLFWCGTGLGVVTGFLLIRFCPDGLAMFYRFAETLTKKIRHKKGGAA
jgi:hypothetical protein